MRLKRLTAALTACALVFGEIAAFPEIVRNSAEITASAADYTIETWGDLTIRKYATYIQIDGCDDSVTDLVIPAEIDGLPVYALGNNFVAPFKRKINLKTVILPDTLKSISYEAFSGCSSLESIVIPDSVNSIGNVCFAGCSSLESVKLPDSTTTIGYGMFEGCKSLQTFEFPKNVTEIEDSAFRESGLTEIVIPDTVTTLGNCVFRECANLKKATLSQNITEFGIELFYKCTSLETLVIPEGLKKIGEYMCMECTSLKEVEIPESVTYIQWHAFNSCERLEKVVIKNPNAKFSSTAALCNYLLNNTYYHDRITIYGYADSTAQAMAEKYDYKFALIEDADTPVSGADDIDGDGTLDVTDMIFLQKYLLGTQPLTAEQFDAADRNKDGAVDAFDLALLKRELTN